MNAFGTPDDTPIFAETVVTSHGQALGGIVAETQQLARLAVKLIKVEYEDMPTKTTTIAEAIVADSWLTPPMSAKKVPYS